MPADMAGRKRVFDSVFPSSCLKDLAPTPVLSQTEFDRSVVEPIFSPTLRPAPEALTTYPEHVIWDRAWHAATSFLTLPERDFVERRDRRDLDAFAAAYNKVPRDAVESIRYVILKHQEERARGQKTEHENLVEWYTNHVRGHFLAHSKAPLLRQFYGEDAGQVLLRIRNSLDMIQSLYIYPLMHCLLPHLTSFEAKLSKSNFQRDLHALAAYALPQREIEVLLTRFLSNCSRKILGIGDEEFELSAQTSPYPQQDLDVEMQPAVPQVTYRSYYPSCVSMSELDEANDISVEPNDVKQIRNELLALMKTWSSVGLGGDKARKIFAAVLDQMLTEFVNWSYASIDDDESGVLPHLRYWIENVFSRYAVQFLSALRSGETVVFDRSSEINLSDVQNWQEMAVTRLGALRVEELFEIVMDWDSTKSRIDDLKHYITNPSTRTYLTSNFIAVLSSRLLQPGVSTLHILRLYISIIRAFRRLDPKGVLLDRVARPVRRYLRDREDTVKVIVTGLFSDVEDVEGEPLPPDAEVLNEAASELKEHGIDNAKEDEGDTDWNNLNWVPDPIDAASDYRKSKNFDVMGSLMSLFESKDTIVKELQTMLSDRLLKNRKDFNQETTVLELLKIRFGESVLQNCSVMLRDVKRESVNINQTIRQEQGLEPSKNETDREISSIPQPDLHAKILSHLFWPTLQDQTFKVPMQIMAQQHLYAKGFSALKQSRNLTWLNALGQVEIELELKDRCFRGEVTPWEASVIYAFGSDPTTTSDLSISRTVEDLATELEMSPLLVRSACKLWLSKSILTEKAPDTYEVLETLPDGTDAAHATSATTTTTPNHPSSGSHLSSSAAAAIAAAETAASLAAHSASESLLQQKMAVYHQFILSLLTNQGAMPLPRIVMMLGMVVPGGFPFSNEELKEFLGRMVRDGEVEMGGGGVYKAVTM
ncbi:hypothetical protein GJ744_009974 [Endocarpon pusillum]|uniref:Anaphase-promoting complex subunit 2 n=1 Tax=Endocarpon pusillum TaxID=364733 RepID=A0A8H7E455_9EURO|nr:hypothetical protein GJ744_009974 [Endocarpon pusillum]